ncbi:MAG: GntR family transcriptional regulator [Alphaproteobacteria bacterium]
MTTDAESAPARLDAVPMQPSLVEQVAERISAAICAGTLPAGERLVETPLADRLGVSRGPVREALRILETEGLVRTTKGRGTFVVRPSVDEVEQMVMMRAMLEGLAARLVTAAADPGVLGRLRELHDRIIARARAEDFPTWRELNWRFHELLCESAGNALLLKSWLGMRNLVRVYLHQNRAYETGFRQIVAHHEAFMAVLESGDPDEAEQLLRSVLLERGYDSIERAVPAAMASWVTRTVDADGRVLHLG